MTTTLSRSATELGRSTVAHERVAVGAAVVLAVALVAVGALRYGITINTDGVGYKATADGLVAGQGLGWWGDPTYITWPPLFPVLLAIGEWLTPWSAETIALAMNLVCVAATVVGADRLLRLTVRRAWLRVAGVAVVAVAPAMLEVNRMLYTEPLFVVLVLACLLALERALSAGLDRRWLAATVGLVWLAYLTRYIGGVLAVSGALTLLCRPRSLPFRRRLVVATAFGAASLVVPAAWTLRNLAVSGSSLQNHAGTGGDVVGSLAGAVGDSLRGLGQWVFWWGGPLLLPLGFVTVVLFVGLGVVLWRRRDEPPVGGDDTERRLRLLPSVFYLGVSLAVLLGFRGVVGFGTTFARYLVPLFVPLVVVGLGGFEAVADRCPTLRATAAARRRRARDGRLVRGPRPHLHPVHVRAPRERRALHVEAVPGGRPRRDRGGQRPPLVRGVQRSTGRHLPLDRHRADPQPPARGALFTFQAVSDEDDLETTAWRERVCLVWVGFDPNSQLLTPGDLAKRFDLVPVLDRHGITVYEVKARGA